MSFEIIKHHVHPLWVAAAVAVFLTACGGGGGGSDSAGNEDEDPTPSAAGFSEETKSWSFAMPGAGDSLCYDIDLAEETPCDDGTVWDFKVSGASRGNASFWSNGGTSGNGQGAAFGMHDWTELLGWTNATTDPASGQDVGAHYFEDSASSIFSDQSWYAYNLLGTHQLHPNYRVYLIGTDPADELSQQFALQVIGYYGGDGGTTSGFPTIRWIDRAVPDTVREQTIDASDTESWVHFDLAAGEVLELDEAAAAASTDWHIAFRRSEIKLNGGSSGPGAVAGFLAGTPDGFYDPEGEPVVDTFTGSTPADTLAQLNAENLQEPESVGDWVTDSVQSILNPAYTGAHPSPLDYGWYTYYPTGNAEAGIVAHGLGANPQNGMLLRSGGGDSYARLHLVEIAYTDPANASSQTTWTFEFNVQAATEQ